MDKKLRAIRQGNLGWQDLSAEEEDKLFGHALAEAYSEARGAEDVVGYLLDCRLYVDKYDKKLILDSWPDNPF